MRLVLLGVPGAGKGTAGDRIAKKYGIPHISTGGMIREAIDSGSDLGRQARAYVAKGDLVPDELVIEIVSERIDKDDSGDGWLLDGFPRTVRQAAALDQRLGKQGLEVELVLDIRITTEEAIRRIAHRLVCGQCETIFQVEPGRTEAGGACPKCGGKLTARADDNEETVRKRLRVYMEQTHPLVHYYAQQGKLFSVDGLGSAENVFVKIDRILQDFVAKKSGDGIS